MKNKNLILLAGAGIVAFFLLRKKTTPTETPTTETTKPQTAERKAVKETATTSATPLKQLNLNVFKKFSLPQNKFKKFNLRGRQVDGFIY